MNRRKFLKRSLQAGVMGAFAMGFYSWKWEPYWVEYVQQPMPYPNLNPFWQGKTIVQLSDLHIGKRFDWQYMLHEFKKIETMQPDVVVYTGDFVTNYQVDKEELKKALPHFPKGKRHSLAVLGNHDYYKNWSDLEASNVISNELEKGGIRVLRNEIFKDNGLTFLGLEDFWSPNFKGAKMAAQLDKKENTLILNHNPDVLDLPIWENFTGWMVCGHTHGGQCKPPFLDAPILPVENKLYSQGVFKKNKNQNMYINRALGCSYPIRFNVRPEITIFELTTI